MKGTVILSHGLESGPDATKVSAMAEAAQALGWKTHLPDYRDIDLAHGRSGAAQRLHKLRDAMSQFDGPLVLAGSSFGAFISGLASFHGDVRGLFLLALPLRMPNFDPLFDCAAVPTCVFHGWHDELIPAQAVVDFCAPRSIELQLVNDAHRLSEHVQVCADRFAEFLQRLPSA